MQAVVRADLRACAKTGKRMAARIAIMAITTSSSISVKPLCCFRIIPRTFLEKGRQDDAQGPEKSGATGMSKYLTDVGGRGNELRQTAPMLGSSMDQGQRRR